MASLFSVSAAALLHFHPVLPRIHPLSREPGDQPQTSTTTRPVGLSFRVIIVICIGTSTASILP